MKTKQKGNRWERHFANLLTKHTGVKWHRTASSGAMATAQGITDQRFRGDIFTEDNNFSNLVIEVKAWKDNIRLEDIYRPKSNFWKWIKQADRESGDKDWVLLFHTNNGYSWVVFRDMPPIHREVQQMSGIIDDKVFEIKIKHIVDNVLYILVIYKVKDKVE